MGAFSAVSGGLQYEVEVEEHAYRTFGIQGLVYFMAGRLTCAPPSAATKAAQNLSAHPPSCYHQPTFMLSYFLVRSLRATATPRAMT